MTCSDSFHTEMAQEFIYFMNEPQNRNYLVNYHLKVTSQTENFKWLGTWFLTEKKNKLVFYDNNTSQNQTNENPTGLSLSDYLKKKKGLFELEKQKIFVFTVCLLYEENKVHYLSFVYHKGFLTSFDPGIQFYPKGQKIVIPHIKNAFSQVDLKNYTNMGVCKNISWKNFPTGIQFNGKKGSLFPADSFCQTWTLFFIIRIFYLDNIECLDDYVQKLCKIPPKHREFYLISFFVLPSLIYHSSLLKKYSLQLNKKTTFLSSFSFLRGQNDNKKIKSNEILSILWNTIESCFPICEKKTKFSFPTTKTKKTNERTR